MWIKKHIAGHKLMAVLILLLAVSASLFGLTLSSYVQQKNLFSSGWVAPKYYALEVNASSASGTIEPGGTASYPFTVSNHNAGGTAQTSLNVSIAVTFPTSLAGTGNLQGQLYYGDQLLASSDTGALSCDGSTLPQGTQTSDTYTLVLTWLNADMTYLGTQTTQTFDPSAISVKVTGYQ